MNGSIKSQIIAGKPVARADILTILQVALVSGEARFLRELAEDWLNVYPYDLHVELLRARALVQETKTDMALKILKRLCELDPEFIEAQESLARLARRVKPDIAEQARAAAAGLTNPAEVTKDIQAWGQGLIKGQHFFADGKYEKAEAEIQAVLAKNPPSPLPALLHIKIAQNFEYSWHAINNLVELYRQQWPNCLQLRLQDAALAMESGKEKEALNLLHACVAEDVIGQVARRLWGEAHRFAAMWPSELSHVITIPLPAKVAAGLGWNHLQSGVDVQVEAKVVSLGVDEKDVAIEELPVSVGDLATLKGFEQPLEAKNIEIKAIKIEAPQELIAKAEIDVLPETPIDLEKIKTDADSLRLRADGRYPAYIALSTRGGLEKQYGAAGFQQVDIALQLMAKATAAQPHWDAHLIYVDDADSVAKFGLKPAKADDPWGIKHLLKDLDEALRKKGEMIGALLIVGGPHVVPFHHLPNPVDDDDKDVPSDNPYACIDENYFVPTWPVGRLPNAIGNDPAPLIKTLNKITASRSKSTTMQSTREMFARLLGLFGLWRPKRSSFGYTAEIWRRASHSVYRTIGDSRRLSISPPTETGRLPKEASKAMQAAYFNLHGLEETGEWYGQRDPQTTLNGPDYPVALSTGDIVNSGRAPQVIYTEACFGANVAGKTSETAIALKFLDSGSKALVGSTVTSYGSVTTPLIAADLLGQIFWKLLNEGYPVGEALRRAKIAMAHTMHRRQGYLDGEDQKTLIAFVLYGDPLAQLSADGIAPKRMLRPEKDAAEVKAICDRTEGQSAAMQDLPAEALATVKAIVKEYLPGMQGSLATMSHEHLACSGHNCSLPHAHAKVTGLAPSRSLVTLSKKIPSLDRIHPHYARITMDAQGKVVKLAVSR